MNTEVLVRAHNVHKAFRRGTERIDVLQGVNVNVANGGFLALMGPSGSGKTTLLNLIGGLDSPTEGSIEVGGIEDALALLDKMGVPLVDRAPRIGAQGHKVAFVHPKATGGVLIELVDKGHG